MPSPTRRRSWSARCRRRGAELDDRAARLASALADRGAGVGTRIAQLDVQLSGVPRIVVCGVQAPRHTGQRQLPVQGARDRLHLRQRRRRSARVPRLARSAGGGRRCVDADRARAAPGRRRHAARRGRRVVPRRRRGLRAGCPHRAFGRGHADAVHRRHHGQSEGCRVAPRRSVRCVGVHGVHVRRHRGADHARGRGPHRCRTARRGQEPGDAVCASVDARDCAVPRDRSVRDGWQRRAARQPFVRRRRAVGSRAATSGDTDLPRRRCVRSTAQRGTRRGRGRRCDPRPHVGDPHRVDGGHAVGGSEARLPAPAPERSDHRHDRQRPRVGRTRCR